MHQSKEIFDCNLVILLHYLFLSFTIIVILPILFFNGYFTL
jgi:hypothetical protein